ncbi:hypothetical protein KNE206_69760 [Kitasatospora sp. NE20-6]|uniref:hypothetical protein n=1 Tax=Kitasatospora sp. NE20-6 TaxID=2859066 RepID=UPI0034DC4FFB
MDWGTARGHQKLLDHPHLAVLDAPRSYDSETLVAQVRALRAMTRLTVLVPPGTNPQALLDAGAVNVLGRDRSPVELIARIAADRRWCASASGMPVGCGRGAAESIPSGRSEDAHQLSQRVLLDLLSRQRGPFCCHDVRTLLGPPGRPMSLQALRGRILRVLPRLERRGLSLETNSGWGREVYEIRPAG